MIKQIYINGCSWTDGDLLDLTGIIDYLRLKGKGRDYSYPKLVSQKLGLVLKDDSRYGGSLNRIVRMTWDYIVEKQNLITDTIFLFEVPNGYRDEIYSCQYKKHFNITSGLLQLSGDLTETGKEWNSIKKDVIDYYCKFHDFSLFDKAEFINFMSLLMYIKHNNCIFYVLQSNDLIRRSSFYRNIFKDVLTDDNVIDLSHHSFKYQTRYELIQDMCKFEKISIGDELNNGVEDSHPGVSGHRILSEIILNHIGEIKKNII